VLLVCFSAIVLLATAQLTPDALAASGPVYMTCDEVRSFDYPAVLRAPSSCDLGLGLSTYTSQTVPGHPRPEAVYLRGLRWTNWGRYVATARGREECSKLDGGPPDGITHCTEMTVTASDPQRIDSAGGAVIYQLIRVVEHYPVRKVVKTLYCTEEEECAPGQAAPEGYDAELGCTWKLGPYVESMGDAEDNCVEARATFPVYYYRPGTDYGSLRS
jgi:hypothetical protein